MNREITLMELREIIHTNKEVTKATITHTTDKGEETDAIRVADVFIEEKKERTDYFGGQPMTFPGYRHVWLYGSRKGREITIKEDSVIRILVK